MWGTFVKEWFDFWRVPMGASAPAAHSETVVHNTAEQAVTSAPEPAPERIADDLTEIKGIGPAVQNKLHGLDILTFDDLAAAGPDALTEKLEGSQPISLDLVRTWTEAARSQGAGVGRLT